MQNMQWGWQHIIWQIVLGGHTCWAVVHGDHYVTFTYNPSHTQSLEQCLLRNDHRGPRLNKYDRRAMVHGDCYVTIIVYLHKIPSYPSN